MCKSLRSSYQYQDPPLSSLLPKFVKTGIALDIGCGRGQFMSSLLKKGYTTIGLDINLKRLKEASNSKNLITGDCHTLPFKDKSINVISILYVLHHIQKPQKTLDEIFRVLKDEGILYIIDIVEHNPLHKLLRELHPFWEGDPVRSRFSRKELQEMLSEKFLLSKVDMSYGTFFWLFGIFSQRFNILSSLAKRMRLMERHTDRILKNRLSCVYRAILTKKTFVLLRARHEIAESVRNVKR